MYHTTPNKKQTNSTDVTTKLTNTFAIWNEWKLVTTQISITATTFRTCSGIDATGNILVPAVKLSSITHADASLFDILCI